MFLLLISESALTLSALVFSNHRGLESQENQWGEDLGVGQDLLQPKPIPLEAAGVVEVPQALRSLVGRKQAVEAVGVVVQ